MSTKLSIRDYIPLYMPQEPNSLQQEILFQTETKSFLVPFPPPQRSWGCENDSLIGHYGIRANDFGFPCIHSGPIFQINQSTKHAQCPNKVGGEIEPIYLFSSACGLIKEEHRTFLTFCTNNVRQARDNSLKYFHICLIFSNICTKIVRYYPLTSKEFHLKRQMREGWTIHPFPL